jgi:NADPH:quinone reductase-like Zn-dependent oxidoreductase
MIERAVQLMEEKNVRPKVGSVYDWENAPSAFEELGRQSFVGRIVVRVGRRR